MKVGNYRFNWVTARGFACWDRTARPYTRPHPRPQVAQNQKMLLQFLEPLSLLQLLLAVDVFNFIAFHLWLCGCDGP